MYDTLGIRYSAGWHGITAFGLRRYVFVSIFFASILVTLWNEGSARVDSVPDVDG